MPTLSAATRLWPESIWADHAKQHAAVILRSIQHAGAICGNPLGVESPGLMTGLAGIGYGLLRCAAPVNVPSVLCLSPPVKVPPGSATHALNGLFVF